jgi:hypothetical protein
MSVTVTTVVAAKTATVKASWLYSAWSTIAVTLETAVVTLDTVVIPIYATYGIPVIITGAACFMVCEVGRRIYNHCNENNGAQDSSSDGSENSKNDSDQPKESENHGEKNTQSSQQSNNQPPDNNGSDDEERDEHEQDNEEEKDSEVSENPNDTEKMKQTKKAANNRFRSRKIESLRSGGSYTKVKRAIGTNHNIFNVHHFIAKASYPGTEYISEELKNPQKNGVNKGQMPSILMRKKHHDLLDSTGSSSHADNYRAKVQKLLLEGFTNNGYKKALRMEIESFANILNPETNRSLIIDYADDIVLMLFYVHSLQKNGKKFISDDDLDELVLLVYHLEDSRK